MVCEKPYISMGMVFRCGQCHPCLVQRCRVWKHRLMLESSLRSRNSFVTLTYNDENVPGVWYSKEGSESRLYASLNPVHLRLFLMRLRTKLSPVRFRFFGVGEYGEKSWRPHYHVVLFGVPTCVYGRTRRDSVSNRVVPHMCCENCRLIFDLWGKGDIELGQANAESMGYVSGYVLKGIFSDKSPLLRGRYPEFSRKSNRPGIGAGFMDVLADSLVEYGVGEDVPCALAHGKSKLPLTRYLRNKLRVLVGREEGCPDSVLFEMAETMREMREAAGARNFEDWKVFAADAVMAGAANIRARSDLYRKGRSI